MSTGKIEIRLNFIVELLTKVTFHLHFLLGSLLNKCLISYELMFSRSNENKLKYEQGIRSVDLKKSRGVFFLFFSSMQSKQPISNGSNVIQKITKLFKKFRLLCCPDATALIFIYWKLDWTKFRQFNFHLFSLVWSTSSLSPIAMLIFITQYIFMYTGHQLTTNNNNNIHKTNVRAQFTIQPKIVNIKHSYPFVVHGFMVMFMYLV